MTTSKSDIALKMLSNDVRTKVGKLIRNAYAIAKNGRPRTDFIWMAKLDEKKGLDVGNIHRRDKSCREFVNRIAQVEKKKSRKAIKSARFVSIMCDGSTDLAGIKEEMIIVR